MNNKLSLIVNFIGIDKMSGAMKNILGLGEKGSAALRRLNGDSRRLGRELRDVQRELKGASGNVTQLVARERELETALAGVNGQMARQKTLAAINTRTGRITARGDDRVEEVSVHFVDQQLGASIRHSEGPAGCWDRPVLSYLLQKQNFTRTDTDIRR